MTAHLLFIDTEASGLPKNWSLPYDAKDNWPNCVQISWVIYSSDGRLIKEEDHYIKDNDFEIAESAIKIHSITPDFLNVHGKLRKDVLQKLANDLALYHPLVVGHFMLFDHHMLGADFFRVQMENPVKREATFCTMIGSTHLIKNPSVKFLRLDQLYETLFNTPLQQHHNAIADARATAACFFELMKRGEVNEEIISRQQKDLSKKEALQQKEGCVLPILFIISLIILIIYQL